jgi:hypothetical protein
MVLLAHVGRGDFDIAMPPFRVESDKKIYQFPPMLKFPIKANMPFSEDDFQIMVHGTVEKRSDWLGQWRPRYFAIVRYKVTYTTVNEVKETQEKKKNYIYLYYWRDDICKDGDSCAEDIINLNSCEELNTMNLKLSSGAPVPDSRNAFFLRVPKYEIQTKVHDLGFLQSASTYYLRCLDEEDFEQWTAILKNVVSMHSYKLYRKQFGAGDFRTVESRRIATTCIDGVCAPSFPSHYGYDPVDQEAILMTQGAVVGNYPRKLRGGAFDTD